MSPEPAAIDIALRIPGPWGHPKELIARLPEGCRLTVDTLTLADGTEVEFVAMPADDQFAGIFRTSCRSRPTAEEQEAVDHYKVNDILKGPGGSLPAAHTMMRAAAVLLQAGGAGVFIDN